MKSVPSSIKMQEATQELLDFVNGKKEQEQEVEFDSKALLQSAIDWLEKNSIAFERFVESDEFINDFTALVEKITSIRHNVKIMCCKGLYTIKIFVNFGFHTDTRIEFKIDKVVKENNAVYDNIIGVFENVPRVIKFNDWHKIKCAFTLLVESAIDKLEKD